MSERKIQFGVVEVDSPEDLNFDLESWLADLLVDYWLLQKGNDGEE